MCTALAGGLGVFLLSILVHAVLWRVLWHVRPPDSYRVWLPALAVIFGPFAVVVAWMLDLRPLDTAAILLLQGTLGAVYVIGYTLVSAFSPSVELLKLVDRTPEGLPTSALHLPFLAGALTTDRIDNLTAAGLVQQGHGLLTLGPRGRQLAQLVLLYRRAIGLPDGGGG